jgi:NAD-dependent DNA ligase
MDRCFDTLDLFGDLIVPEKLSDLCYSVMPDLVPGMTICLTGYFACARGNIKRVEAMQARLKKLNIHVTEGWRNDIDVLVVGDRATIVSLKIKNAIKLGIPIVKESDLLEDIRFYKGAN